MLSHNQTISVTEFGINYLCGLTGFEIKTLQMYDHPASMHHATTKYKHHRIKDSYHLYQLYCRKIVLPMQQNYDQWCKSSIWVPHILNYSQQFSS